MSIDSNGPPTSNNLIVVNRFEMKEEGWAQKYEEGPWVENPDELSWNERSNTVFRSLSD